jgi:hypothetical protein
MCLKIEFEVKPLFLIVFLFKREEGEDCPLMTSKEKSMLTTVFLILFCQSSLLMDRLHIKLKLDYQIYISIAHLLNTDRDFHTVQNIKN